MHMNVVNLIGSCIKGKFINYNRDNDDKIMYTTSGAGSRASAEQFVGSYDLVEFTLVLVGDTIRKSAIRPLKNGPRAHKSKLIYPVIFCITESSVAKIETQLHFCSN